MAATTGSASTKTTTNKEGVLIKGRDVIMLDAPEILPSPKTPLLTEAQDIVGAINELKKLSSGEGGDDWQPPADWIPVPEPGAWEAYLLIELRKNLTFSVTFSNPDGFIGEGTLTIDWGDGTVIAYEGVKRDGSGNVLSGMAWSTLGHVYKKAGQYLIKITTEAKNCFFLSSQPLRGGGEGMLIAKFGENIRLKGNDGINMTSNAFSSAYILHYVSANNAYGLDCFTYCYALRKIDLTTPLTEIPNILFLYNYSLSNVDFSKVTKIGDSGLSHTQFKKLLLPECTEIGHGACSNMRPLTELNAPMCTSIGNDAFANCYNLREIYAPNCTNVGDSAFASCYTLEKATFAENCTFGRNAFNYCYNLYPRPDGSTN